MHVTLTNSSSQAASVETPFARRVRRVRVQARAAQARLAKAKAKSKAKTLKALRLLAACSVELAFCPTGPDGGVDNSCGADKGGGFGSSGLSAKATSLHAEKQKVLKQIARAKKAGDETKVNALYQKSSKLNKQIKAESGDDGDKAIVEPKAAKQAAKDAPVVKESCCVDSSVRTGEKHHETLVKAYAKADMTTAKLSQAQTDALDEYSAKGYKQINGYLRKSDGKVGSDAIGKQIKAIDAAIERAPRVPKEVIVERGQRAEGFDKLKTGDEIAFKSFVSTTTSQDVAESFQLSGKARESTALSIRVPKGARAIYLPGIRGFPRSEQEMILPRGSKFRVEGVKVKNGVRVMQVALIADKSIELAFCPTGPGGGQDNSCSNKGTGGVYGHTDAAKSIAKLVKTYGNGSTHARNGADQEVMNRKIKLNAALGRKQVALEAVVVAKTAGDQKTVNKKYQESSKLNKEVAAAKEELAGAEEGAAAQQAAFDESTKSFGKALADLAEAEEAVGIPTLNKLEFVKTLPGSTKPALMQDKNGKQWVVKQGAEKQAQIKNEFEADEAYRALGVPVPKSGLVATDKSGSVAKVAEFIPEGKTLSQWRQGKTPAQVNAMHDKISEHFVADALLANWDSVGTGADNVLVSPDGVPYRLDSGGALKFRAQGASKGAAFGASVGEIDSLRDPAKNPDAARVFSRLTSAQIAKQIDTVQSKRGEVLGALVGSPSAGIISARFNDLKARKEQMLALVLSGLPYDIELAFCPTGPDGGQDNSCGSKGGGGSSEAKSRVLRDVKTKVAAIKHEHDQDEVLKEDTWVHGAEHGEEDEDESEDDSGARATQQRSAYLFKTKSGREFTVGAFIEEDLDGEVTVGYNFTDAEGSVDITNKGDAFEVFSKVVPAVLSHVERVKPNRIEFSAKGKSRQRLYDRLTSTLLASNNEYKMFVGLHTNRIDEDGVKRYALVRK